MIPSARRLMQSLRDIGYDTPSAIADLVDNSIDADARNINVSVAAEGKSSWIRVADDGAGMTASRLDEAMRYGSSRSYGEEDLGAFGLGLKTASLSQCRRLTVASRTAARGKIEVRRWDLDRVARRDAWELQRLTPARCPHYLTEPLANGSGTVVLWESLDRVLDYARPDGQMAMRNLEGLTKEIGEHLAMVFHRFLSGELRKGRARIAITVNSDWLEPWDPFARDEAATQELPRQWLPLRSGGTTHRVGIRPYVLPNQVRFSSPEAHLVAGGPKRWNRQQGLYVYRRDRLIQSGGWNRLRTSDEHSKLARIAVNIPPSADALFRTNVSKMNVTLPAELRPALRALASGVVAQAQDAYRQRMRLVVAGEDGNEPRSVSVQQEWRLGDHWGRVVQVLEAELGDQPELLRRVLVSLTDPGSNDASSAAASR
jgi:Histidine kinase-, DNA gyrase B-, and HSP90-like ATPase